MEFHGFLFKHPPAMWRFLIIATITKLRRKKCFHHSLSNYPRRRYNSKRIVNLCECRWFLPVTEHRDFRLLTNPSQSKSVATLLKNFCVNAMLYSIRRSLTLIVDPSSYQILTNVQQINSLFYIKGKKIWTKTSKTKLNFGILK